MYFTVKIHLCLITKPFVYKICKKYQVSTFENFTGLTFFFKNSMHEFDLKWSRAWVQNLGPWKGFRGPKRSQKQSTAPIYTPALQEFKVRYWQPKL